MLEARAVETMDGVSLPEGWELKLATKSTRFNEGQNKYMEDKINLGQQTGHKQNAEQVARDMSLAKKTDESKLFSSDECRTAHTVFSRMAYNLRHAVKIGDLDIILELHKKSRIPVVSARLCWMKYSYSTPSPTTILTSATCRGKLA